MTRFARSKGSKSSNERIPEQATPWEVMSNQLNQKRSNDDTADERAKFEAKRKENYEKFLKEEVGKKTQSSWCEFPDIEKGSKPGGNIKESKNAMKKKKRKNASLESSTITDDNVNLLDSTNATVGTQPNENNQMSESKKNKKKSKKKNTESVGDDESLENSDGGIDVNDEELVQWCDGYMDDDTNKKYKDITSQLKNILEKDSGKRKNIEDNENKPKKLKTAHQESIVSDVNKKTKKKAKGTKKKSDKSDGDFSNEISNDTSNVLDIRDNNQTFQNENKKKTKKLKSNECSKKQTIPNETIEVQDDIAHKSDDTTLHPKKSKKAKKHSEEKPIVSESKHTTDKVQQNDGKKINTNKNKSSTEYSRRKPISSQKNTIFVNGEEVEVVNLQGFPVTSIDATRIESLRKVLISKGIPRSEVERTIKLERRKAEKKLARLKKNVCFQCRKSGHVLSECPELNKDGNKSSQSTGMCFKCGSTEHTHFACKVVRSQDYKFAQCFICKEQGHITRQCPDNPRGIYPKGGACRVCGDVTHFRKDCPKVLQQKEDDTIRLETLQSENIEDINDSTVISKTKQSSNSVKRIAY